MKATMTILVLLFSLVLVSPLGAAEKANYPAPRFPSYLKPPKSIDDIMPFARAAVRQTGGRTPLGLVEKGTAALIVTEAGADPMVMQAIKRAYEEGGVKIYVVSEHELRGVNKEDALKPFALRAGTRGSKATWKCGTGSTTCSSTPKCRRNG
jgi:hypothetical protein